jgi:hypothetical protein
VADSGALNSLLRRARRRVLWNLALAEASTAGAAALAVVILLLLVGTQILDWHWPALLFVAALAVGLWRIRRRLPGPYATAQLADRRLGLPDSLSTAYYFGSVAPGAKVDADIIRAQALQAERDAAAADIRQAAPLVTPRGLYVAGVLALVASGMLGVRYGLHRSLDLRAPIAPGLSELFRERPVTAAAKSPVAEQKRIEEFLRDNGISLDEGERIMDARADSSEGEFGDELGEISDPSGTPGKQAVKQGSSTTEAGSEASENSNADSEQAQTQNRSGDDGQDANDQQGGNQQKGDKGSNDSLLDKMRDAMASLLNKLKIQPKGDANQQSQMAQGQEQGKDQQSGNPAGKPMPGKPQGEGAPNPESQSEQEGEGAERAQAGEGKQGDRSSDQRASQEARSGVGKSDGDKDLKDAEQLAAMGKISEIIGKRSQNITGEVMVEVSSGKQTLKTPYSQRTAHHAEAGGEIHRDDVPLEYQHYVQQYFEHVRRLPLPKKTTGAAAQ